MRPTQALSVGRYRHLKLTTKDVNKGFYKGNRTGSMGRHTKYGGYIIEWEKVRTYAVPDLKAFPVRIFQDSNSLYKTNKRTAYTICEQNSQGATW